MIRPKILFVCSRNKLRSRTAETLYRNSESFDVRSCGTAASAVNRIQESHVVWADQILVMEHEHAKVIRDRFRDLVGETPIVILNITDDYAYMDPELVEMIDTAMESISAA